MRASRDSGLCHDFGFRKPAEASDFATRLERGDCGLAAFALTRAKAFAIVFAPFYDRR
jgi:hypothetical protein